MFNWFSISIKVRFWIKLSYFYLILSKIWLILTNFWWILANFWIKCQFNDPKWLKLIKIQSFLIIYIKFICLWTLLIQFVLFLIDLKYFQLRSDTFWLNSQWQSKIWQQICVKKTIKIWFNLNRLQNPSQFNCLSLLPKHSSSNFQIKKVITNFVLKANTNFKKYYILFSTKTRTSFLIRL